MPEVVGSAYVVIRAITTKVASDIKDSIDKGAKEAAPSADKAGKSIGDRIGTNANKSIAENLGQSTALKKALGKTGTDLGHLVGTNMTTETSKGILAGRNEVSDSLRKSLTPSLSFFTRIRAFGGDIASDIGRGMSDVFRKIMPGKGQEAGHIAGISLGNAFKDSVASGIDKVVGNNGILEKGIKKLQGIRFTGIGILASIATPAIIGAIKVAIFYVVGLAAQLANVATAALGAGIGMAGAFAAAIPAIGVLLAALKTESPLLDKFKNNVLKIEDAWKNVAKATQSTLLPALEQAFRKITDKLAPVFQDFGRDIGQTTGDMAKFAASVLTTNSAMDHWQSFLKSARQVWKNLTSAVGNFLDALAPLLDAIATIGVEFSATVQGMSDTFKNFIKTASDNGTLQATFQRWWDSAKVVFGGIRDLIVTVWNVLQQGSDAAQPALDKFAAFAKQWRDFTSTPEGKNKIKTFFEEALKVTSKVNEVIGEIVAMLFAPLTGKGNTDTIVGFLDVLQTTILPALATLITDITSNLSGDQLSAFVVSLTNMLSALSSAGVISTSLQVMTVALGALTAIINTPGIGTAMVDFLGFMWGLSTVAKIPGVGPGLMLIAKGISAIFESLVLGPIVDLLAGVVAGLQGVTAASAAASAAEAGTSVTFFQSLGIAAGGAVAPLLAVAAPILAVVAAITAIYTVSYFVFPKVRAVIDDVWDAIQRFKDAVINIFTGKGDLKSRFAEFEKALGNLALQLINMPFAALKGGITNLADDLKGPLSKAFNAVKDKVGEAGGALVDWVKNAVPKALEAIGGFAESVGGAILGFVTQIPGWLAAAGQALIDWIDETVPKIPGMIGTFWGTVAGYLVLGAVKVSQAMIGAANALIQWIIDAVPQAAGQIAAFATTIGAAIITFVSNIPGWVVEGATTLWSWISVATENAVTAVANFATTVGNGILNFVRQIPGWLVSAVAAMTSWIGQAASDLPGKLASFAKGLEDFITGLPGKIVDWFFAGLGALASLGEDIVEGIKNGILGAAQGLYDTVKDVAKNAWDAFTSTVGIRSPSKLFATGGRDMMLGVVVGINKTAHLIDEAMTKALSPTITTANTMTLATPSTSSGPGAGRAVALAAAPVTHLQVYLGTTEITDLVKVEADRRDAARARVIVGRGVN